MTIDPTSSKLFIQVIRQPERSHEVTVTGLKGFVSRILSGDTCEVVLLRPQLHGKPQIWTTQVQPEDFIYVYPTRKLIKMRDEHTKQAAAELKAKKSSRFKLGMRELRAARRRQQALKDFTADKRNPYLLPNGITRRNKENYPAYWEFVDSGLEEQQRLLTCTPGTLTIPQAARLGWYNEAGARTSFWSGVPLVRKLVQELDLDPFVRSDGALYTQWKDEYTSRAQLRVSVIRALNQGRVIICIEGAVHPGNLCADSKDPKAFLVTTARRRKLPAEPADVKLEKPDEAHS